MAYVSGNASSLSDLLTALRNACTANGWTLSGNVLEKGTCFVEILYIPKVGATTHVDFGFLQIRGGTGKDGSNNLTGAPPDFAAGRPACGIIGPMGNTTGVSVYTDWDWPVTYYIHINDTPDEVYMMVNYFSNQYWQGMSFGQSPAPGCPDTGNWVWGSNIRDNVDTGTLGRVRGSSMVVVNPGGSALSSFNGGVVPGAIPFWAYTKDESSAVPTAGQFHGTWMNDGVTTGWSHQRYNWNSSGNPSTAMNVVCSALPSQPLPTYSPNTWNNEAHLVRLQILTPRLDWKSSIVGELIHARYVRNDFLDDGEILTLGSDQWKVYPAYRKDVTARNGTGSAGATPGHSGTSALALRYTP